MRFYGSVGYGESVESKPGVYTNQITEKQYFGDVVKNTRRAVDGEYLNDKLSVTNSISIVADAYALEHFFDIRYVKWQGLAWTVTEVEVQRPRMLLRLGVIWNGPQAAAPVSP